jgi:arsenate reductase (glutaredoxin)
MDYWKFDTYKHTSSGRYAAPFAAQSWTATISGLGNTLGPQTSQDIMQQGTVKFFNTTKGFGFITPDVGGKDVFVPNLSVVSSGVSNLKTGQRVSFETSPDAKGPKAVNLVVLADVLPQPKVLVAEPVIERPKVEESSMLTLYHDPDNAKSRKALADLRAAGHDPRVVEYLSTPVTKDELKPLSALVSHGGQNLVRKYDPLFLALQLDDRFISESDFWDAIVEHPALINGPIVATADRACVCTADNSVKTFLAAFSSNGPVAAPKKKGLSPRLLKLLNGETVIPPMAEDEAAKTAEADAVSLKRRKAEPLSPIKIKKKPKPEAAKRVGAPLKSAKVAKKKIPKTVKKAKRKLPR